MWLRGRGEAPDAQRLAIGRLEGGDGLAVMVEGELTVEVVADFDARAGVGTALRAGWDLEGVSIERDGIVIGDLAAILKAQHIVRAQVGRPRAKGRAGLRRLF